MAYGESDLGYIECQNCDIFYNADDNDNCPLCAVDEQARELLEACKAALKRWYADDSHGAGTSEDGEIARILQEAIAKAEGK